MVKGFYPPLYDRDFQWVDWYAQYVHTYVERDLRQLVAVKDLSAFERFLGLCAGRTGQVLNKSDLARDADVSHTTASQWLSVLEASFLVFLLPPWHANYSKRITKSPKLYFYDVGLAGFLVGVTDPKEWITHPMRGAFFETMVVSDLIKTSAAVEDRRKWYFWRSPSGPEVDLIGHRADELSAFEIKTGSTFRPDDLANLLRWAELARIPARRLHLLYAGRESFVHRDVQVSPWWAAGPAMVGARG
jgi:predicted AAA+ superfamily ATPase